MTTGRGDIRGTQRWKRIRKLVLANATQCRRCGLAFILYPPRNPRSPSVDHIVPLHHGGDPFALSNLAAVCYGCNSRGGQTIAASRAYTPRPATPVHRW